MSHHQLTPPSPDRSTHPESSALLQTVLASVPDAILCFDRDWRLLWANPLAMRLSRLSPADLGRNHWELYPETLGTAVEEVYRRAMRDRTRERFEFFYPPFALWLDHTIVPGPDGGLITYYSDVSEKHTAETARNTDTRRLQQVFDSTADCILIVDQEWTFTFANRQAIHLLHSGPLVGEHLFTLFPGGREEPFWSNYQRAMVDRVPTSFEAFYPEPLNIWFRISTQPFEHGGLLFFFSDVTAQKQAEVAREQVLDTTDDGVISYDRNWRFTYLNRRGREIVAASSADPLGKVLWELFPEALGTPFEENLKRTMIERVPTSFQAFYPEPLNLWLNVEARPSEGGIITFSCNVTGRKAAEAARDRILTQLNQVFDATADCIVSVDHQWNMTFLNRRAQELVAPFGDVTGKNLWETFPDIIYPDSPFVSIYRHAMEERLPGSFEAFYPEPLAVWLEVQARPSEDGIVIFFRDITARRASEVALREQQELLASIQRAAGVATWSLDLGTGAITYGQGSAPIYGRPLHEVDSIASLRTAMHPDSQLILDANLPGLANRDGTVSNEYRMLPPDGRTIWVESRSEIVRKDGVATHRRGLGIDITARKQTQEASEASEARYRVLVDLNPQALWSANPAGEIIYANQGFLDYLGLDAPDPEGWLKSFAPEDHDRVGRAWADSIRSGDPYDIQARLIRGSDAAPRWWHLRALPVRDETRAIIQWLGVANDIDDEKTFAETLLRLQASTERERAELEAVYNTAPIGLALFDLDDFRYLRLNDRQAAFFNLSPDQIVGRPVTELAPIAGLRELFEGVARGTPVINQLVEGELPSQPGEHRFWTVNYSPVRGPDGTVRAIAAASLEITQQKRAEAALVQSEKLAAVGRLASSISHEINNPLEAITNLLYLTAMNKELPADVKDYIQLAQSELARVSQIATQTLRFHRQAVRPTEITAAQLVSAVLNLYQGRLNNSGITVDTAFSSATPILCFENDIRQVLNNLIANASDAMRSGGKLLGRAHDTIDRHGRPAVRISIADTGHGMDAATLKRIYEPFFTTKDLNGTGLGLWISAGIMDRHDGRITVRSSQHPVHHGTVFSLILPVGPRELQPSAMSLDSLSTATLPQGGGSSGPDQSGTTGKA